MVAGCVAACAGGCKCGWPKVVAHPLPEYGGHYGTPPDRDVAGANRKDGKKVRAAAITGVRLVHVGDPKQDVLLVRLTYPNGNWCNVLLGGTELDISPLLNGSGIVLTSGWAYVHGKFPSVSDGVDPAVWALWPIVVRKNLAAGAEGTTFVMDCRDPDAVVVTVLKDETDKTKISLWDYTDPSHPEPLDPPNDASGKYLVEQDYTQWVKISAGSPPAPTDLKDRASLPAAYEAWLTSVGT